MDIPTKSREYLTGRFKKNAIPTETDFKDLIEAPLNQKDDGIAKPPGEPLSLEALSTGNKPVLKLYESFSDASPSWALNLQDGTGGRVRKALVLSDGAGSAKLTIDQMTGDLKVGALTATGIITANEGLTVAKGKTLSVDTLSASGLISANGGITVAKGKTLSVDTLSASGLISANEGLTVAKGKTLTSDTLTANGLISANAGLSVAKGKTLSADTLTANGLISANEGLTVAKGKTLSADAITATGLISANGGISTPEGVRVDGNRTTHLENDGSFYRYSGQVYITVDDNFYIRDMNATTIAFHFNTDNARLGVGKTSPACALDVIGDVQASGSISANGGLTVAAGKALKVGSSDVMSEINALKTRVTKLESPPKTDKETKETTKDTKDLKDASKETKETKETKEDLKDIKDKNLNDSKTREKTGDLELSPRSAVSEALGMDAGLDLLEQRIARLEAALFEPDRTFITPEERPRVGPRPSDSSSSRNP